MLRALQNQRRKSADAGFTLIELLIVIVILGVLAAIVVFSVQGINNSSNKAACQATVSEVDTAYEAAVAQGDATSTSATVASLASYFHNGAPTKAGTHDISGMTVAGVDGITC